MVDEWPIRTLTDSMSRSLSRYLWPKVLRHMRRSNLTFASFSTMTLMFNLLASNHQVICTLQVYTTIVNCKIGVENVRKNCSVAVEDQTVEGYEVLRNPKYELYTDTAGKYRLRLKAANGEIVAASQGYTSKASAKNGIASVGKNAPDAEIDITEKETPTEE